MGDHIIGMKSLKEISTTVKAASEHSTKLYCKSFGDKPTPTPEPTPEPTEPEMDKAIMKALLSLDDAGRSYAAGLEDDACEAFLKKSAEDRTAEVTAHVTAEKAKTDAAAEAEKAKSAIDPTVASLQDKVKSMEAERVIEKAAAREGELKDIAKSQFPLVPTALTVLKSADKLTEADRQPILDSLKSQQEFAKRAGDTFGDDNAVPGDATARHTALVAEVAKTKNISKAAALLDVANSDDPEHQKLINDMRAEMAG